MRCGCFVGCVEAIEFIQRADPKDNMLLITDIVMPQMNGLPLVKAAREKRPRLPVIVITGYGSEPMSVEFLRLGYCEYLDKPFDDDTILKAVHRSVERLHADAQLAMAPNAQNLSATTEGAANDGETTHSDSGRG